MDPLTNTFNQPVTVTVNLTDPHGTPLPPLTVTADLDGLSSERVTREIENAVPGAYRARIFERGPEQGERQGVLVVDDREGLVASGTLAILRE